MTLRGTKNAPVLLLQCCGWSIKRFSSTNVSSTSVFIEKRRANASEFFEWAHNCPGITQRKVKPFVSRQCGGYGLQAAKDIKKGEVILAVGQDVWQPYDTAYAREQLKSEENQELSRTIEHDLYQQIAPYNVDMANAYVNIASLALLLQSKLEDHKNVPSYLKFILDSVKYRSPPPTYLMNDEWMSCLNGTICGGGIKLRRDMFHEIADKTFTKPDEVKMLASAVITRGINDDESPFTLVPYLDLVNHNKYENVKRRFLPNGTFELYSVGDILEGEEVFTNYAEKTGTNFLIYQHGFMQEGNDHDTIAVGVNMRHPTVEMGKEDEWRNKIAPVVEGKMYFELPIEKMHQISRSDWEKYGAAIADVNQGKVDPKALESSGVMELVSNILNIARCAICKDEEEYINFPSFEEENAVGNLLDAIKENITQLKLHEKKIVDNSGDMSKPTVEWQRMCNTVRSRELTTYSMFFRSMMYYGAAYKQNLEENEKKTKS